MRRVFGILFLAVGLSAFADGFEWADYERLCWTEGAEPSYEIWQNLSESGQCYGDSLAEAERHFRGADGTSEE